MWSFSPCFLEPVRRAHWRPWRPHADFALTSYISVTVLPSPSVASPPFLQTFSAGVSRPPSTFLTHHRTELAADTAVLESLHTAPRHLEYEVCVRTLGPALGLQHADDVAQACSSTTPLPNAILLLTSPCWCLALAGPGPDCSLYYRVDSLGLHGLFICLFVCFVFFSYPNAACSFHVSCVCMLCVLDETSKDLVRTRSTQAAGHRSTAQLIHNALAVLQKQTNKKCL